MNATLAQPPCRKFFFPAALRNPLPKKRRIPPGGGQIHLRSGADSGLLFFRPIWAAIADPPASDWLTSRNQSDLLAEWKHLNAEALIASIQAIRAPVTAPLGDLRGPKHD